jgi:hypothetical protein
MCITRNRFNFGQSKVTKTSKNPLPPLNATVTPPSPSCVSEENIKTKMKRKNIFEKVENITPEDIKHEINKPEIVKYADETVNVVKQDASFEGHDHIDTDKGGICSLDPVDNTVSSKTDVSNPIVEDNSIEIIEVVNVSDANDDANDNGSGMSDDINAAYEIDKDNEADLSGNDNVGGIESPNLHDVNSDASSIRLLVDHGHRISETTSLP